VVRRRRWPDRPPSFFDAPSRGCSANLPRSDESSRDTISCPASESRWAVPGGCRGCRKGAAGRAGALVPVDPPAASPNRSSWLPARGPEFRSEADLLWPAHVLGHPQPVGRHEPEGMRREGSPWSEGTAFDREAASGGSSETPERPSGVRPNLLGRGIACGCREGQSGYTLSSACPISYVLTSTLRL